MKKKRYVVEMDFYIHAESDETAKLEADKFRGIISQIDGGEARVQTLHHTPYGSLRARRVL